MRNGDYLVATTERSRGIGEFDDPIHPQVADHFNVTWVTSGITYAYYHEGKFSSTDRLRRYIRFQYNEHLLKLRQEMGGGRLGQETMLIALKMVTYDPFNWYAHFNLAELYRKLGDQEMAMASLRIAAELDPSAWAPLHTIAGLLLVENKLDAAAQTQRQAIQRFPDKGAVHFQLGLIMERMGDIPSAREGYGLAIKLEPNSPVIKSAVKRLGIAA